VAVAAGLTSCEWEWIRTTVRYRDFVAFDTAARAGAEKPPGWMVDSVVACTS